MFEIFRSDTNKKFYFRLKATNGLVILSGQGYSSKVACQGGIKSVRKNAKRAGAFETKASKDGRHYFTLTAANGEVIGQSQMYKSASGLKGGIESVQKNAPSPTVKDLA